MSEKVRNGYEKIKVSFKVKADASEEKIRELVDIAQKRSPVFDMKSHPTPVEVSLDNWSNTQDGNVNIKLHLD